MKLTWKLDGFGGDEAYNSQHGNATVLQLSLLQELNRNEIGEAEWIKSLSSNETVEILWGS